MAKKAKKEKAPEAPEKPTPTKKKKKGFTQPRTRTNPTLKRLRP